MVDQTYVVVAAVHTNLCRKSYGRTEPEENNQAFENGWKHWVDAPGLVDGSRQQEEECKQSPDGAEHDIVDNRRAGTHCDHVSDKGHDDHGDENLCLQSVRHPTRRCPRSRTCSARSATEATFMMMVVWE